VLLTDPEPRYWRRTQAVLQTRSESEISLEKLTSNSPLVSKYVDDFLSPTHSVLGIDVSAGFFFSVIAVVIGCLSVALVPALAEWRYMSVDEAGHWLLLYARAGLVGGVAETAVIILSATWAMIPGAIIYLQQRTTRQFGIELHGFEELLFDVGFVLGILATILNVALVCWLFMNRRRIRRERRISSDLA
jgi:hypothetical protein